MTCYAKALIRPFCTAPVRAASLEYVASPTKPSSNAFLDCCQITGYVIIISRVLDSQYNAIVPFTTSYYTPLPDPST
jgi:hypothetical protein